MLGIANPFSSFGKALITETAVANALGDCKVNSPDSSYDLYSDKFEEVNVKSSHLYKNTWVFSKHSGEYIPNNYICLRLDEDRSEVIHTYIIPGEINSGKKGFRVTRNSKLYSQFEVNSRPYNREYNKNLN